MIFAFMYPLLMGMIPIIALAYLQPMKKIQYAGLIRAGINLFYSGIATLTLGSISSGVVEIYGTTNHLIKYFYIFGCPLLLAGLVLTAIALVRNVNRVNREDDVDGEIEDVEVTDYL